MRTMDVFISMMWTLNSRGTPADSGGILEGLSQDACGTLAGFSQDPHCLSRDSLRTFTGSSWKSRGTLAGLLLQDPSGTLTGSLRDSRRTLADFLGTFAGLLSRDLSGTLAGYSLDPPTVYLVYCFSNSQQVEALTMQREVGSRVETLVKSSAVQNHRKKNAMKNTGSLTRSESMAQVQVKMEVLKPSSSGMNFLLNLNLLYPLYLKIVTHFLFLGSPRVTAGVKIY